MAIVPVDVADHDDSHYLALFDAPASRTLKYDCNAIFRMYGRARERADKNDTPYICRAVLSTEENRFSIF